MKPLFRPGIVCLLLSLSPSAPAQDRPGPEFNGIDHAQLQVSSAEEAHSFYQQLFGEASVVPGPEGERFLLLGNSFLSLREARETGVAHIALRLEEFDQASLGAYLDMQEIPSRASDEAVAVADTDRIVTMLVDRRRLDELSLRAEEAGEKAGAGIFRPLMLDEVHITVSDMEVDSLFYSRLLGSSGQLQAGSLWFRIGHARLRLSQAPVGHEAGINYISVLVSNTDLDAAAESVFEAGGLIENILPNGFSFWDPDGLRIVIRTANQL